MDVRDEHAKQKVIVRLFTRGKWKDPGTLESYGGYTVWTMRIGKPHPKHHPTVAKAVEAALKV